MSTATRLNISDIIVVRGIEPEPLPDGLARKVYNEPIIVRGDGVLIDGLRRLRRAKANGETTINAIISSDYPTLMLALKAQHSDVDNEVAPRRLWEIYDQVFTLGVSWSRSQFNGGWVKAPGGVRKRAKQGELPVGERSILDRFQQAFDYSRSAIGHVARLYRLAEGGDLHAQQLAGLVDRGELSPQRALANLRRPYNLSGNVTNLEDQRRVLERGTAGLAAQVDALTKLGYPIQVPIPELELHYKTMYDTRTKLTEMINGLRKVIKEAEVTHG